MKPPQKAENCADILEELLQVDNLDYWRLKCQELQEKDDQLASKLYQERRRRKEFERKYLKLEVKRLTECYLEQSALAKEASYLLNQVVHSQTQKEHHAAIGSNNGNNDSFANSGAGCTCSGNTESDLYQRPVKI